MTDERLCKNCLRWLPVERFQKGAFNRNGRPYVRYTCKDCVSFRRACQRAGAASVKGQSRTCKQCGTRKPLSAFYMNSGGTRRWTCGQCCITNKRERIHAMRRDDPVAYAAYNRRCADAQARRALARLSHLFELKAVRP